MKSTASCPRLPMPQFPLLGNERQGERLGQHFLLMEPRQLTEVAFCEQLCCLLLAAGGGNFGS